MDFEEARRSALAFRDARDWAQFHTPKDLAISIALESAELLELFQWSGADTEVAGRRPEMAEELADILIYSIFLADALDIDISEAIGGKLRKNEQNYPVEKARGTARKYTEL